MIRSFLQVSFLLILFFVFTSAQAQVDSKIVAALPLKLKKALFTDDDDSQRALVLANPQNKQTGLFVMDQNRVHAILLSESFELLKQYEIELDDADLGAPIIGGFWHGNACSLFTERAKMGYFTINFETGKKSSGKLDISLLRERYFNGFAAGNKFYVLTLMQTSPAMQVYEFSSHKDFEKISFDLDKHKDFYRAMSADDTSAVVTIVRDAPTTLATTQAHWKVYPLDGKIVIGLDFPSFKDTRLLTLDQGTRQASARRYALPKIDGIQQHFNSLLYQDKLYQCIASGREMRLQITDINSNQVIKEYRCEKDQDISFKNTPIIQKGSSTSRKTEKELEKTSQFLKRIADSKVAIAVNRQNDKQLILTLGSYQPIENRSPNRQLNDPSLMNRGLQLPGGKLLVLIPSAMPALLSFNSEEWIKSAYFESLFDKNTLEHQPGAMPERIFSIIRNYREGLEKSDKIAAITMFYRDGIYFYGYYHQKDKKYYLVGFE